MSASPNTPGSSRPQRTHDVLGTAVTPDDHLLPANRLPTKMQVLRAYLSHTNQQSDSGGRIDPGRAHSAVIDQVIEIYERAHIPMVTRSVLLYHIKQLYQKYRDMIKIKKTTKSREERLTAWRADFSNVFEVWGDVSSLPAEDASFLENQRTTRTATMGGRDMNLANKVKRKLMRDEQEQRRIDQEAQRVLQEEASAAEQCFSELEGQDGDTEETDVPFTLPIPSPRHHKKVKMGGEHFIPPDILARKEVVECFTRNKITPTAGLAVVSSIITAIGGDTRKFKLSYGTSYRFRLAAAREMAEAIKDQWNPAPISVLHWDEKLMETLDDKYLSDERMPVLLSGMGQTKLLGISKLPTHSTDKQGIVVSSAVCALLKEWDIDTDCVKFMSFDTTSANTGYLSAACIQLQVDLNKPMLWSACRHHVGEIVLTHVWDALAVEVSKSPEVTIFHRLRDEYFSLTTSDLEDLVFPELEFTTTITKEEVLSVLDNALKSKMARDDYKEVIVLTKLFITQDITNFRFKKPGAIHKARWMAKILCGYKLVLLEDKILKELPPGTIFIGGGKSTRRRSGTDRVQQKKLVKFVNFIVAVYVPWWVTCGSATDAAEHDIIFLKAVKEYEDIDPQVSQAALAAFCRHLWYLTPELLPLCLFSNHLEEEKKEAVCKAIVAQPKLDHFTSWVGTGYQKPSMPDLTDVEFESIELDYFVGPDSWKFFQITGIPTDFLNEPVSTWTQIPAFISAAEKLKDLQVKNDAAERGVRLGHEFLGMAVKEKNYQNILQVAENSRKKTPNQRSSSASGQSGNWYLTW